MPCGSRLLLIIQVFLMHDPCPVPTASPRIPSQDTIQSVTHVELLSPMQLIPYCKNCARKIWGSELDNYHRGYKHHMH
eukprot:2679406-Amphidinium_carterae.1